MSKQIGPLVFTATPEMASQMPGIFKTGATYVAHQAAAVAVGSTPAAPKTTTKKTATKPSNKKKKKTATKTATKKTSQPAAVKATKRKSVRPDLIIAYVRKNEGCNMTDIEGHTRLPQAAIRRVLNSARDDGAIRTEGRRRGLRYFPIPESADALATAGSESDN